MLNQTSPNRKNILNELYSIVHDELKGRCVRVCLFGSWARQEEKQSSDIDLAVHYKEPAPPFDWNQLTERIEESTIPYRVQVVDLKDASLALKEEVEKEGVVWIDYTKD